MTYQDAAKTAPMKNATASATRSRVTTEDRISQRCAALLLILLAGGSNVLRDVLLAITSF